jgi:hypothetical protein
MPRLVDSIFEFHLRTAWKSYPAIDKDNTVSVSTTNGESAFVGLGLTPRTSKSSTTIRRVDMPRNKHAPVHPVVRRGKPIRHCSDYQRLTCNVLQRLDLLRLAFRTHRNSTRFRKLVSFRRTVGYAPLRYPETKTKSSSIGFESPLVENWRCRFCSPFVLYYDSAVTPDFRCRCVTLSGRV